MITSSLRNYKLSATAYTFIEELTFNFLLIIFIKFQLYFNYKDNGCIFINFIST